MSIATQITALQNDKTAIANAITAKGGTVASGDGFDDFATDIGTIHSVMQLSTTFATKTQTVTISNVPFTIKKIIISSTDVRSKTITSADTNYDIMVLELQDDNLNNYCVCRFWRTDYVTPKAGYGTAAFHIMSTYVSQSGSTVTVQMPSSASKYYFSENCTYYIELLG